MTLKEYIQGSRKGKEANRIERQAMNDPFLHDALEGFDAVKGDHARAIERLERKVDSVAVSRHRRVWGYWAMAASVLLIVGFGILLITQRNETRVPGLAAGSPETKKTAEPAKPSLAVAADTLKKEHVNNKLIAYSLPAKAKSREELRQKEFVEDVAAAPVVAQKAMMAERRPVLQTEVPAPAYTVTGRLTDENGQPLAGASVIEKGTKAGVVTDKNGCFSLSTHAADSTKLVAGYIGYESKEVVATANPLTIRLTPDTRTLNEVVVVGYSTNKVQSVTGAVTRHRPALFGKKEFLLYCAKSGAKGLCDHSVVAVKVSFLLSSEGRPTDIKILKATCDEAADEAKRLLQSSPVWTAANKKITLTMEW
jgi:hypothetical protein